MPYYISLVKWCGRKKKAGIITAQGSPGPPHVFADQPKRPTGFHRSRIRGVVADSVHQPKEKTAIAQKNRLI